MSLPGADRCPTAALPVTGAAVLTLALAVVGVIADFLTPLEVLVPVVFGVPILLCLWVRDRRFLWGVTVFLIIADLLPIVTAQGPVAHEAAVDYLNRGLVLLDLLLIALLVHLTLQAQRGADEHRQAIERHNTELEAINRTLTEREEEIVRQNEELQAQSEELERQSEELRITNEELAAREKTLEQLLELSRSLTAELDRSAMLQRICEAMGLLIDAPASAILERRGDVLEVVCHHGFGPHGPEEKTLPLSQSFASLVLARGQTGYIEDLTLRPDLVVPRVPGEERFRSVLGSPLRVHGRGIGTIEIYHRQKQAWSDSQVALIESLAAQASSSLASAELVEAIQQERRRFEAVFRTVPVGMLVADRPDQANVRINAAAAAAFGVPVDQNVAPGTTAGERLIRSVYRGGTPAEPVSLPLYRGLGGEEVRNDELDLHLPDGRHLTLLASAAPIADGKGRVAGAVCAFTDITAQKALQRELDLRRREAEEASLRKTRFLAAVSHDIRTPANAINLMAELIRRSAATPALAGQVPELAERLQANTAALVDLVSDVLDLARFDSGKIELQETEFSLGDLLLDEGRNLLPLAQDKGLTLIVEPPPRPVWLRADRVKLSRVLANLMGNAIKFTPRGEVQVTADLTPRRDVVLRVRDTGVGIAPESIAHIFDEFVQLRNPERDRAKGTGLGLAISKRLVEVMGGTLAVDSAPGIGSTFTVTLPASCVLLRADPALPRVPAPVPGAAARKPLAGLRILLVEDHNATREGTAQLLTNEGAVVTAVGEARSGLSALRQGRFDVLLLDMMLPDMDGREVLRVIQNERPAGLRRVLVLTGDLTEERHDEVKQLGADALVAKPVDVARLLTTLAALMP